METLKVSINKESQESKLGLSFYKIPGTYDVILESVDNDSPFADSKLVPGASISKVNNANVSTMTAAQVETLVKAAPAGTLSLTYSAIVAEATKETAESKVGISIQKNPSLGYVRIYAVSETGLFANKGLKVGQRVTAINGKLCPEDGMEAVKIVKESSGVISITAIEISELIETKLARTAKDTVVGISLVQNPIYDFIYVSDLHADGILAQHKGSRIEIGQTLVSINGIPCPDNVFDAVESIKETVGELKLETIPTDEASLEVPTSDLEPSVPALEEGQVVATFIKKSEDESLGIKIRLVDMVSNAVIITDISPESPLASHPVEPGMQIISINSTPCPQDAHSTVDMIQGLTGTVHLVASFVHTIAKRNESEKIGVTIGKTKSGVVIAALDPDGIFASSKLKPGQKVLEVNGNPCPASPAETVELLKTVKQGETVHLVTSHVVSQLQPKWAQECLHTLETQKSSIETDTGLVLKKSVQGRIMIHKIEEGGIFASYRDSYGPGHIIVSINGVPRPSSVEETSKLIQGLQGHVMIVIAKCIEFAAKSSREAKVGISIGSTSAGLAIAAIAPDCIFQWGTLRPDQKILRINGQPCPETVQEAIELLNSSEGTVSLEAVDVLPYKFQWPEESKIVVSADKEYESQYIGLRIADVDGKIVITHVDKAGIFGNSSLFPGLTIVAICDEPCPTNCDDAIDIWNGLPKGEIKIVAVKYITVVRKPAGEKKLGMNLARRVMSGDVVVHTMVPGGLIESTPRRFLEIGQRILEIDGEPCPSRVKEAIEVLQTKTGKFSITSVEYPAVPWTEEEEHFITVKKSSLTEPLGLGLMKSSQGRIAVSVLHSYGIFTETDIVEGEVLVAINGRPCPESVELAFQMMKGVIGDLTIVFAKTIASVSKESKESSFGIRIAKSKRKGIVIQSIDSSSPFSRTKLQVMQKIHSINGAPCPESVDETISLLKNSPRDVTMKLVDAVSPMWSKECYQVASLSNCKDKFLGIEFGTSQQGRVAVARVDEKGLFASTGASAGQVVVSINGTRITSPEDAASTVKEDDNVIVVLADTIAIGEKMSEDSSLGLTIGQTEAGILVTEIDPSGAFGMGGIEEGQKLVTINGKACPADVEEVATLLKNSGRIVKLMTRDNVEPLATPEAMGENTRGNTGDVTERIASDMSTASVTKESADVKVGLVMKLSVNGKVVISKMKEDSLFSGTNIAVGHTVVSINGVPCPPSARQATDMVKESSGVTTIETVAENETLAHESEC